jgi:transmembrane sensor
MCAMTGPPSSTANAPDWERIARYLAGESTPAESADVERWLAAHPSDARAIQALDAATKRLSPARPVDVEAALRNVKTRRIRVFPNWGWGIAAAAAIAVFAVLTRPDRVDTPALAPEAYSTEQRARDTVTLADGSRIILGPASRLSVTSSSREIELEGEAFFTIVHDAARPYTVRANGVVIRDIGTEFGVRGYDGEPLRVFVTSGAVELARSDTRIMLDSGDVGIVQPGGRMSRTADAVTTDDVAWTQGKLVFREASMAQLAADLRRWYGVELRVSDPTLARRHFSGVVYTNEPADRVANAIALSLGARAERRGDTISIIPVRSR